MSEKFIKEHSGKVEDISIYGQESNRTTFKLCRMNLAIRGVDGIPFEDKMKDLTEELKAQMEKEGEINKEIKKQLGKVGFKI